MRNFIPPKKLLDLLAEKSADDEYKAAADDLKQFLNNIDQRFKSLSQQNMEVQVENKLLSKREEILQNRIEVLSQKLGKVESDKERYEKALDEIDSVLELREIIESYELQFTLLMPENLRLAKIHSNPVKNYEDKYERWIWILANCQDERIKVLADALKQNNATDRFCVMIASLYTSVSKRFYFLMTRKNHSASEMIASLKNQGMLNDASLEQAVLMLVEVLPEIPNPVAETLKKLKSVVASMRGLSPDNNDKGDGLCDSKKLRSS